jgi:cyanophycinase-like exopeptidase
MTLPRLLVIMGSGETAPTMKAPHRSVFERIASRGHDVAPVMLDTPFGFQENAPILAASTTKYFSDSTSQDVAVAGLARTDGSDSAAIESAMSKVRDANWVFAGPGSPTFALRQWQRTGLREILAEKLAPQDEGGGGALVFSSAAALTLGVATVPVYEIYKVGMDPWWEPGLNLLADIGVNAAVIPHYDNQEGGNHDTRFCYLGERRLMMLEPDLPDGAFVLGIDEHTGVIIDLDAETVEIVGKGALTLRRNGHSVRHEAGTTMTLDVVRTGGVGTGGDAVPSTVSDDPTSTNSVNTSTAVAPPSLGRTARELETLFNESIASGDSSAAVTAMLDLDAAITEWSADTLQSDEMDRARRALRSMIVKLGHAADDGLRDPRDVLGPVVEAALDARRVARQEKAYAVSDAVRDGLDAAGIEVRDTANGVEWVIRN